MQTRSVAEATVDGASPAARVGTVVLTVLLAAVAVLLGASPAAADEGLRVTSTSRYVLDPEALTVSATLTMTLRNTMPNEPTGDGGYRYFFFDSLGLPLPSQAQDVQASSSGRPLRVVDRPVEGDPGFAMFEVQFPELRYETSRAIEMTFTLTGQPPRSEDPTRIGPGYATFDVFSPGDPGASTVEVVVPSGLEVDSTAESFIESDGADGMTVYTSQANNLSPGFSATMSVRGDDVGEEREVSVGGVSLVLVPYPNDPQWADFIEDRADVGLPVMMELLGQEWPGDIDRIREDSGSSVRGFEGWYSTRDREIVLGEGLEDGILFHELAHAWVNTSSVEDRWLSEGLAEIVAEETAARTDGSFVVPSAVRSDAEAAVPLQTWKSSPGFRSTEVDDWAYPASYQVVDRLLAGLAEETLPAVLADSVTATSPYDLPGERLLSGGALGTLAFFDILAEHQAPAVVDGTAAELYARWVLTETDAAALALRPAATTAYAELAESSPWAPPLGLRRAMAAWTFDTATATMTEQADLLDAAHTLVARSERAQTDLPDRIQRDYETADTDREYAATAAAMAAATTSLGRYEQARAAADAERNALGRLGAVLLGIEAAADAAQQGITLDDFAAADLAADQAVTRAQWATRLGAAILTVAVLGVALLALLAVRVHRSARPGQQSAAYPI